MRDYEPIDTDQITAKGCRWLRAADGRVVEYSISGSQRPDARVLVSGYFAGMPEPKSWRQAFEALNVKVIDLSFPGLGLSSLHPGRKIAEWPGTDLQPVLEAEGVEEFTVYGTSYGTPHAMAVAQHFGPARVRAMGLRVPYLGLPLSTELGLPVGQPRFPTTDELQQNTLKVKALRSAINFGMLFGRSIVNPNKLLAALMKSGALGGNARGNAMMSSDYPEEVEALAGLTGNFHYKADSMMYMMAQDVALDQPGLDPRKIELSDDRVVVWYAADDDDCPPSHGEWLANHFRAKTRVFEGYGHLGGAFIDHAQFVAELMGPA